MHMLGMHGAAYANYAIQARHPPLAAAPVLGPHPLRPGAPPLL